MRHLLGLHVKTNQHYFFHFAIPRIQEDDLYIIIVQNLGGPTHMKLLGGPTYIGGFWGLGLPRDMMELCRENFTSKVFECQTNIDVDR